MDSFCRGVMLLFFMLLFGFQARAQTSATARSHDSPVNVSEIQWSKLVWYSATIGGRKVPHAAPFIEIHVDGMARSALMELDTGTNISSLYGKTLPRATPSLQNRNTVTLSGTIAGCPFANQDFEVLADQGDGAPNANGPIYLGTVGLGFFKSRILLMDLVSNKVAILSKDTELPESVLSRAQVVPADYRGGKLYVKLNANGVLEQNMFFDSGSSSSSLVTTPAAWERLTGRKPGDSRNSRQASSNWGKDALMIAAPMSGSVCVSSACISRPTIKFESTGLTNFDFANYPTKTEGYFGLVLFDGRFTVIVDVPHGRFGLVKGSMARQLQK